MLKIGLIGTGKFGENHLKNLIRLDKEGKCDFVGITDSSKSQMTKINKKYGLQIFQNIDKMLSVVDAVDVVTPASTHYEIVKKCLINNKHVLVEKPLSLTLKDSIYLYKISKLKKKKLLVGHLLRFDPLSIYLKKLVHSNEFGNIIRISGAFLNPGSARTDVGAILNYSHHVDLCNFFTNSFPTIIFCKTKNSQKFEDYALISMTYPNQIIVNLELGWSGRTKKRKFTIEGTKKSISIDFISRKLVIKTGNLPPFKIHEKHIPLTSQTEPLYNEIKNLIISINTNKMSTIDAYGGVLVSQIHEKSIASSNKMKTIKIKLPKF